MSERHNFGSWDPAVARDFIAKWEGLRLEAYRCSAGVLTIGYGHTEGVTEGMTCTKDDADRWLVEDIRKAQRGLAPYVNVRLTEGQFIALVSLAFNVGAPYVAHKCPRLMRAINADDLDAAADEFLDINKANGVVIDGLTRRRKDEASLFLGEV